MLFAQIGICHIYFATNHKIVQLKHNWSLWLLQVKFFKQKIKMASFGNWLIYIREQGDKIVSIRYCKYTDNYRNSDMKQEWSNNVRSWKNYRKFWQYFFKSLSQSLPQTKQAEWRKRRVIYKWLSPDRSSPLEDTGIPRVTHSHRFASLSPV